MEIFINTKASQDDMDKTSQSATHDLYSNQTTDATMKDVIAALVTDVERGIPIRPEELGTLVEEARMPAGSIANLRAYLSDAQGRRANACLATRSYHAAAQYLASIEGAKAALPPRQFSATEAASSMPDYFP